MYACYACSMLTPKRPSSLISLLMRCEKKISASSHEQLATVVLGDIFVRLRGNSDISLGEILQRYCICRDRVRNELRDVSLIT
jgi:hypothetical protein